MIEDANGIIHHEEDQIAEVISSYYRDIFSSNSGVDFQVVNEALVPCVSEETNQELVKIP